MADQGIGDADGARALMTAVRAEIARGQADVERQRQALAAKSKEQAEETSRAQLQLAWKGVVLGIAAVGLLLLAAWGFLSSSYRPHVRPGLIIGLSSGALVAICLYEKLGAPVLMLGALVLVVLVGRAARVSP
jgi:hypothetical protein